MPIRGRSVDDGAVTTAPTHAPMPDVESGTDVPGRPRLRRTTEGRIIGGVASGLAEHVGLPSSRARWAVRGAFLALSFSGGLGLVLYAAYWIVLPEAADGAGRTRRAGPLWLQYVAAGVVAVVVLGVLGRTSSLGQFFLPIVLACVGGALVWRQAGEDERARWRRLSTTSLTSTAQDRVGVARLVGGVGLVVAGAVLVLAHGGSVGQLRDALLATVVVAIGFALITGPFWMRAVSELGQERRARVRAQEREELAAHVHDSVLQTLALIQRNADAPREVARLARGQERELRTLLYHARPAAGLFSAALHEAVAEVEDDYAVTVDEVVVGDAPLDDALGAMVAAAREAMVNAAKHAGVAGVSLYAELDAREVSVFVRDRGRGFDPDTVPDDRQGLRGSITARVERHGGTVRVRTGPDQGTEIELRMGRP